MNYLIWLVTSILFGVVAAWMAKSKGRDPVKWFGIGVVLNIFVLVALAGVQKKLAAKPR